MLASSSDRMELHSALRAIRDPDLVEHRVATNHASMTLTALYGLASLGSIDASLTAAQADAHECIRVYAERMLPVLRQREPAAGYGMAEGLRCDSEADVWACRGRRDAVSALGRFLCSDIDTAVAAAAEQGDESLSATKDVLGRWLARWIGHDKLRGAIGCAAMHGLLRIAFGIDAGFNHDVALGTAYVIAFHIPETPVATTDGISTVEESLERATALPSLSGADFLNAGNIDDRCTVFFKHADFATVLPKLSGDEPNEVVRSVVRVAVSAFSHYHDFSALHLFTGSMALSVLVNTISGHVSNDTIGSILNGFWSEALAIALQLPTIESKRSASSASDAAAPTKELDAPAAVEQASLATVARFAAETLRAAAEAPDDVPSRFEHRVKLAYAAVFAATRAEQLSDDPQSLVAACRRFVKRELASRSLFV